MSHPVFVDIYLLIFISSSNSHLMKLSRRNFNILCDNCRETEIQVRIHINIGLFVGLQVVQLICSLSHSVIFCMYVRSHYLGNSCFTNEQTQSVVNILYI